MRKNLILFLLTACSVGVAFGQDNAVYKKVVVIEKTDKNGKVTETRKEAVGAEADELLKSLDQENLEEKISNKDKSGQLVVWKTSTRVPAPDEKSEKAERKMEHFKIIKMDDGKEKVLEWDGQGEMPAEIAKEMKNLNINEQIDGENRIITIDSKGPVDTAVHKQIIIMHDDKLMDKEKRMRGKDGRHPGVMYGQRERKMKFPEETIANKATLGVMIEDTDQGVIISDIVDGSAAAKAGLRRGDTILKINNTYIFTSGGLLDALKPFNPKEKIKVRYIRDGKEKSTKAILGAK